MTFNLENPIGTGTDAELLVFTRAAIARVTLFGFMQMDGGNQLTRDNLPVLRQQLIWLEQRIADASAVGGDNVNLAMRRRAQ